MSDFVTDRGRALPESASPSTGGEVSGVTPGVTAIVCAMQQEIAPLLQRVQVAREEVLDACQVWEGTLEGSRVVLARTGEGRELAMQGLEAVTERFHLDRIFVVGVAGGLSPELESGALVVANRVMQGATELPSPDTQWLGRALDRGATVPGVIVSARRILGTAAEKQGALAALGSEAPAAVDLESAAYAAVASERGLPYLVLRAISDTAEDELPFDMNDCRDPNGGISRARVVQRALMRPGSLPMLLELRKRVNASSERLAGFVVELLRGGD